RKSNLRWVFLTAVSLFFYGSWNWSYLSLIIISGLIDYFAALGIARFHSMRKTFLIASLSANLGILFSFKYVNFAIDTLNSALVTSGASWQFEPINVILPVGISFYTFQSMSYTIDVYRGSLRATKNVFFFFSYLSMFP